MKKKIFNSFLIVTLILSLLTGVVYAANENLTTYTEIDPNSHIVVTADDITFTNINRNEAAYVYKDFGVDYFDSSFTIDFDFNIDTQSSSFYLWTLSNYVGGFTNILADLNEALTLFYSFTYGTTPYLYISEADGGTIIDNEKIEIELETTYYVRIVRNETIGSYGRLYCYLYSDSERTNLITSEYIDLDEKYDFRYNFVCQTDNGVFESATTGKISNFELFIGYTSPTIETKPATNIQYNEPYDWFEATLSGNITDDGGEPNTVGFYYQIKDSNDWWWTNVLGTYETGDNFTAEINLLEVGETYEFYAYGYNSVGTDNGTTLEFIVEPTVGVPSMRTLAYPFSSDNNSALLYGDIPWDGNSTSNVTAWIQWRESTSEDWIDSTDNVSDLVTDDSYSCNITGLSLDTFYDYRAAGLNSEGTAYAPTYSSFQLMYTVTTPELMTLDETAVTDTTARLWGNVVDDGNSEVFAYFQYRIQGASTWINTSGFYVSESDNYSQTISNLQANTSYEYRAYGWNYNPDYTRNYTNGDTLLLHTYTSTSLPIISTGNVTYLQEGVVTARGTVVYDGGGDVALYFQVREAGTTEWIESDYKLTGYRTNDEGSWYVSGLVNDVTYQLRAVGDNAVGTGYGNIVTFQMSVDLDTSEEPPEDDDIPVISDFAQIIDDIKAQFHLYGVMGTWAFLGLILLVIALVFGVAIVATPDAIIKRMVSVAWGLISIAVLGAFLFTGQLGIWPILIIVGGVVVLIFIIGSSVLSGSSNNG